MPLSSYQKLAQADVQLRFLEDAALARQTREAWIWDDSFAASFLPGLGDLSAGTPDGTGAFSYNNSLNPTANEAWYQASNYDGEVLNGLFYRLAQNGTLRYHIEPDMVGSMERGDVSGWGINWRDALLHSKIGPNANAADFASLAPSQLWEPATSGDIPAGRWYTVLSSRFPNIACIQNQDVNAAARTVANIPANRSVNFYCHFTGGGASGNLGAVQFGIGDKYYLLGRHGKAWQLLRSSYGKIVPIRTFEGTNCDLNDSEYRLSLWRLNGEICVTIASANSEQSFHVTETRDNGNGEFEPIESSWPKARVSVVCSNVRATVGFGTRKWSSATGTRYMVQVKRKRRRTAPTGDRDNTLPPLYGNIVQGWVRGGTGAVVSVTDDGTGSVGSDGIGSAAYTLTLTASDDGIDTPLVGRIQIKDPARWSTPTANAFLEVSKCVESMTVSMASPPSQMGTVVEMTFNETALDTLYPNWQNYIDNYRIVELDVRHKDSCGAVVGSYIKLFRGYAQLVGEDGAEINNFKLRVRAESDVWRLSNENARISYDFMPLDYAIAEKAAANNGSFAFYGSEGVRRYIAHFLGEAAATALEVRFPDSHYPIWSSDSDKVGIKTLLETLGGGSAAQPPTSGSLLFEPPWQQDAVAGIAEMARYDDALFMEAWHEGDNRTTTYPSLRYGRPLSLMHGRPTWRVVLKASVQDDKNYLCKLVGIEYKTDRNLNELQIYSTPPGGGSIATMPALRIGVAREEQFVPNSPNRQSRSWKRVGIRDSVFGWEPGGVEYTAQSVMESIAGVKKIWPTFGVMGDARYVWGDGITLDATGITSSLATRLTGQIFRIESVTHEFFRSCHEWGTTVQARPLSSKELGVAQSNASLTGADFGIVEAIVPA